jgi:hypothetical protein
LQIRGVCSIVGLTILQQIVQQRKMLKHSK